MQNGKLIAGIAMAAEGVALAYYGSRYIDFMDRHGMTGWDLGKRVLKASGLRNRKALAVIGITQAVLGLGLISSARRAEQRAIAA